MSIKHDMKHQQRYYQETIIKTAPSTPVLETLMFRNLLSSTSECKTTRDPRFAFGPFHIPTEDLFANAFIESLKVNPNKKFLSFKEIEDYGQAVIKELRKNLRDGVLDLSRNKTQAFILRYPDCFSESEQNGVSGLKIADEVTTDFLIQEFRGTEPLRLLELFLDAAYVFKKYK